MEEAHYRRETKEGASVGGSLTFTNSEIKNPVLKILYHLLLSQRLSLPLFMLHERAGSKTTDFEQPSQRFESLFAAHGVPARAKFLFLTKFLTLL